MAALPVNSTDRWKYTYTVGGETHDFQVRTDGVTASAVDTAVAAFLTALSPNLNALVITKVEFSLALSTIFGPIASTILGSTYGSGAGGGSAAANEVNFIGRSIAGRRVRLMVFGNKVDAVDYRFAPGENAAFDAAVVALNAPGAIFVAIDGIKPIWYPYVNAGVNAHWQKALRP